MNSSISKKTVFSGQLKSVWAAAKYRIRRSVIKTIIISRAACHPDALWTLCWFYPSENSASPSCHFPPTPWVVCAAESPMHALNSFLGVVYQVPCVRSWDWGQQGAFSFIWKMLFVKALCTWGHGRRLCFRSFLHRWRNSSGHLTSADSLAGYC